MQRITGIGIAAVLLGVVSLVLAGGSQSQFVGASRCKECHPSAFLVWKESSHARARTALTAERSGDARCTQCHGTSEAGTGDVQCESCHGPGLHYARRNVMRDKDLSRIVGLVDVTEAVCQRCHTDTTPAVLPFDHSRLWPRILHGREPKP